MGLRRVRHNLVTEQQQIIILREIRKDVTTVRTESGLNKYSGKENTGGNWNSTSRCGNLKRRIWRIYEEIFWKIEQKGMGSCREQNTGAFALESNNRVTGILEREQNNVGEGTQRNNSGQLPTIEKLNLKLKRLTNSGDKKCFDPVLQQLRKKCLETESIKRTLHSAKIQCNVEC